MLHVTPLGAALRGLVSGLAGSAAQDAFFALTRPITPGQPEGAFEPPEAQQTEEQATETVARRVVEGLAARGPLPPDAKRVGGRIVHYAFGGGWGVVYGLTRESARGLDRPTGAAAFGAGVWAVSDNGLLPLFNLAGGPRRYPLRNHAYAVAAHLVYGLAVCGVYGALRPVGAREPRRSALGGVGVGLMGLAALLPGGVGKAARVARGVDAARRAFASAV
ncbi:MAG: DUF1440 domain-containing protein [Planctomycetes bacterium]|nr:DUF1440 domain-containing protein [Planctomycetota bacterium]